MKKEEKKKMFKEYEKKVEVAQAMGKCISSIDKRLEDIKLESFQLIGLKQQLESKIASPATLLKGGEWIVWDLRDEGTKRTLLAWV